VCPTFLYSIDIASVSVFTVQIDDTSDETEVSAVLGSNELHVAKLQ